jgi:DNA-binding response OmpR family regulator
MKKILIIEDDAITAHLYKNRLEQEGYKVEVAADGQAGFYRILDFCPTLVLLDLMLPKMNGIDILKRTRGYSEFANLPVLVFTNAYIPNMVKECYQAGATVFNKACLTPRQVIAAIHDSIAHAERALPFQALSGSLVPVVETAAPPVQPAACETAPDASAPADRAPTLVPTNEDQEARLAQLFLEKPQETVALLRKWMHEFSKATRDVSRLECLPELYRKVHAVTSGAGLAGLANIAQIAATLELLLTELYDKPKNINASTLRTISDSIELIANLLNRGGGEVVELASINIMVVDDEILSRRAVTYALEKAGMKATSVEGAEMALALATERTFNGIFLDVQMPGMDGFQLCTKIRALARNRTTPVIFVTSLTDFKSRARSSLSGGNDFIAKPFMLVEMSLKALTYVMRSRTSSPLLTAAQAA